MEQRRIFELYLGRVNHSQARRHARGALSALCWRGGGASACGVLWARWLNAVGTLSVSHCHDACVMFTAARCSCHSGAPARALAPQTPPRTVAARSPHRPWGCAGHLCDARTPNMPTPCHPHSPGPLCPDQQLYVLFGMPRTTCTVLCGVDVATFDFFCGVVPPSKVACCAS